MLTFRKGVAGGAGAMASYLCESDLSEIASSIAAYYGKALGRAEDATSALAEPLADMHPEVAKVLGIDTTRAVTEAELANLIRGLRADGAELPGNQRNAKYSDRDRVTYYDFTFTAPKSLSILMGLAKSEDEMRLYVGIHRQAVRETVSEFLEPLIGQARKGKAGCRGTVPGRIGGVAVDHYTARHTVQIPVPGGTISQSVRHAGDPNLHTHLIVPNLVVVVGDGTTGSLHTAKLHGQVKSAGTGYYQVRVGELLRQRGIATESDENGLQRVAGVSKDLCDLFSKRHNEGERLAKAYADKNNLEWDALSGPAKIELLRVATQAARNPKEAQADWDNWRIQAEVAGLHLQIERGPSVPRPTGTEHIAEAYKAALPLLEREFEGRSVVRDSVARYAAVRGFMQTGVRGPEDIDAVTALMRSHGVQDDGEQTRLLWGKNKLSTDEKHVNVEPGYRMTTRRHLDRERAVLRMAEAAAADRAGALTATQIRIAVRTVVDRDGLNFVSEHGRKQRNALDALGRAGRFSALTGVAGSGKTSLLRPLIEAWNTDGRRVFGTAIARRQSDELAGAGIRQSNVMPLYQILKRAEKPNRKGGIKLDLKSVVVIDEASQVSTRDLHRLLRLQKRHAFRIVAIGDDRQNQAIEAGSSIRLVSRVLGKDETPALLDSVRQVSVRDRETALMFRNGNAKEAISRLDEDGRLRVVPGGYRQTVEAAADFWMERQRENAGRPNYRLTVSAHTNAEARDISAAIRARQQAAGELGPDRIVRDAEDQNGHQYRLPLAVGDRVRIFGVVNATMENGRSSWFGNNGAVVRVEEMRQDGATLLDRHGTRAFVRWDDLRAKSGRTLLSYGHAITVDAIQGATSTDHLDVMAAGSASAHAFKAYPAQSRATDATWMFVSEGAETADILARRALGQDRTVTPEQVRENVAGNLSRAPEKELAVEMVERVEGVREGGLRTLTQAERDAARQRTTAQSYDAAQMASQRQQAAQQSAILSL